MPWLKEALLKEMKATLFCWQVEDKRAMIADRANSKTKFSPSKLHRINSTTVL
jgi:hypothetical protein